ncbi:leucyl aminopeptidase family protein [Calditerrivibrio nitroreducens]|uniref:Probable cytosol aminopeptidase n=1 Tax=Calditerrivibrio nitroreducens (strain DSM 19672 / NBRC 101217 / Yu37-1) TaxID=768670 RepID=E4TI54_CALNY|nr:leucyl aminopeptidase [Calditerrivibrio nitroreducens]ADR18970.1 peptidase M17 leucyl aminopeptidase domain protein [Calditerrivibrio nitroreducens DSM 19672]
MIKIIFQKSKEVKNYIIPLIKEGYSQNINGKLNKAILNILQSEQFEGGEVKKYSIFNNNRLENIFIVSLPEKVDSNSTFLELGHKVMKHIDKKEIDSIFLSPIEGRNSNSFNKTELFLEGMLFGYYNFDIYKSKRDEKKELIVYMDDRVKLKNYFNTEKIGEINALYKSIFLARDLINMPPNELTPQRFCEIATTELNKNLKIKIFDEFEIKDSGMNLLYTVGKGSENRPRFLVIEYSGDERVNKKYAFVGKGITFDSGGTNLKPTGSIETMKSDMSGAANILALAKVVSESGLKLNATFYIPLAENTIGQTAYRPGDIIKSYSGKTVEILNTDAEGRLILADAISFAVKEKPDIIIDMATLTGACVVALGSDIAGCFSNNDNIYEEVYSFFRENGEHIVRLPLHKNYRERLKSKNADLQNISKKRTEAGAIMGALFLENFVEDTPWIHFDIAGTAFMEDNHPVYGEGGSGFGIRSLYRFLKSKEIM